MTTSPGTEAPDPNLTFDLFATLEETGQPENRAADAPSSPESSGAERAALAGTELHDETDRATVLLTLTARTNLLASHIRYSHAMRELAAVRVALTPCSPEHACQILSATETIARRDVPVAGWLPPPPAENDEAGWRGWCAMIEEYARLAPDLLPRDHPDARWRAARIEPRPAAVPETEAWLLTLARKRIDALLAEARRRYHAHPWFVRDRETPGPLLRVRARLCKHREAEERRSWDLANDSMDELDAILVRCAPRWWYRLVVSDRGATPLEALEAGRREWITEIDSAPDPDLYCAFSASACT
jgi:hypothetical protein